MKSHENHKLKPFTDPQRRTWWGQVPGDDLAGHGGDSCPGVAWHVLRHGLGTGAPRWAGMSVGMAWGHLHDRWGVISPCPLSLWLRCSVWHQLRQRFGRPGSRLWKLDPPLQKWGGGGVSCPRPWVPYDKNRVQSQELGGSLHGPTGQCRPQTWAIHSPSTLMYRNCISQYLFIYTPLQFIISVAKAYNILFFFKKKKVTEKKQKPPKIDIKVALSRNPWGALSFSQMIFSLSDGSIQHLVLP